MSSITHTGCDAATAAACADQVSAKHPRLVLATTIFASSLAFIDGSVVNVGLPAIGRALHGGAADLQWVVNAYLLPLSALILLGGAAGDRFGRQRLLIGGIALFALASAACALAPGLAWLTLARGFQGVGAAILLPNSLAILGASFSGEAKGRAIGLWAASSAIAGALGPVLGGWLIDTVGWRAIFLVNLPLAAAGMAMAALFVRDPPRQGRRAPLDMLGAMAATAGLAAMTWGLTIGSGKDGWTISAIVGVVAGAALMLAFVWVQKRRDDQAMMSLALFGSKAFIGLSLLTLLLYGALGGLLVLLPYVLIQAAHYSGTAAGAALLPFPLILAFASPVMGSLAGRIGPRLPLTIGPVIVAGGLLLMMRIDAGRSYWTTTLPAILVISMGMAGTVAPLTTAVLSAVDARHTGSASGFNSALARTGGLVATALLGAVLGASGEALIGQFRAAAVVGAALCLASAASAFLLIPGSKARAAKE